MGNADKPAYPIDLHPQQTWDGHTDIDGLTKRERFAIAAMQSLIPLAYSDKGYQKEWCARHAVQYADETLKALEEYPND